jgi:hypothetical protein
MKSIDKQKLTTLHCLEIPTKTNTVHFIVFEKASKLPVTTNDETGALRYIKIHLNGYRSFFNYFF